MNNYTITFKEIKKIILSEPGNLPYINQNQTSRDILNNTEENEIYRFNDNDLTSQYTFIECINTQGGSLGYLFYSSVIGRTLDEIIEYIKKPKLICYPDE